MQSGSICCPHTHCQQLSFLAGLVTAICTLTKAKSEFVINTARVLAQLLRWKQKSGSEEGRLCSNILTQMGVTKLFSDTLEELPESAYCESFASSYLLHELCCLKLHAVQLLNFFKLQKASDLSG